MGTFFEREKEKERIMEDDLEAEIEALLESDDYEGELNNELLEPIWLQELKTALREDYIDSDTVKFILDRNILPDDDIKLRIQIWQVLLVVNGRSNHFSPVEQKIDFGTSTRKLGSKQLLGEQLIGHYLATRGVKFTPSLVDIVAPLVSLDHLADWEKYNLFYAIQAKFRPKSGATLSTLLELLIQYYDPLLYRFIKARQLNIITRSVDWIESLFRDWHFEFCSNRGSPSFLTVKITFEFFEPLLKCVSIPVSSQIDKFSD